MIWCFSPTGTSLRLAQALGGEIVDLTTPTARQSAPRPGPNGLFTLVFPVHGQRVPSPLRSWLKALPRVRTRAVLLCTYGSVHPGGALSEAAKLLRRKGMTVTAAAALPGPHSYRCARTKRDLNGAGETDLPAAQTFYRQAQSRTAPAVLAPGWDPARLLPDRLAPVRLAVRRPRADPALCKGCGRCRAVCPAQGGDCIRCAACVVNCPTGARTLSFRTQLPAWFLSKAIKPRPPRFQ